MDLPLETEEAPSPESTEETPAVEEKKAWISSHGRSFKLALFGVVGCLLISGIALGIWSTVGFFQAKKTALAREKAAAQALVTAAPRLVFRDFLIPLPEGNGYRILQINFVAELGKNRKQADLNANAGIRRQVMNAIQLRGNELLVSAKNRDLLKKDLVGLMNQILGEGAVTNVYLTDFTFI
jgi:flagellar basal body-associated protein FliL